MNPEIPFWYALAFLSDLKRSEAFEALEQWNEADGRGLPALFEASAERLEHLGLPEPQIAGLARARARLPEAREALRPVAAAGLTALSEADPRYPRSMAEALGPSRPPLLFCAGNVELLAEPAVSVVGARKASQESLDFTYETCRLLAEDEIVVVSGFAEGVDRHASETALEAGGATILVLAQGLLTFGRERGGVSTWIDQGRLLAISAFEPRAPWQTPFAMARNAVITALAPETVVGQAGKSGGSWEAARIALRQGRRVWLRETTDPELGHAALARQGARLVPWPAKTFLGWARDLADRARRGADEHPEAKSWTETLVMQLLRKGEAADIHEVSGLTGDTLERIVEGRGAVALNRLLDLRKIRGLGPSAVEQVALAFGLAPPSENPAQLTLFPPIEEFPGWDSNLTAPAAAPRKPPEPTIPVEPEPPAAPDGAPRVRRIGRRDRKNVLLLMASGLRADALGCTGHPLARTPHLDRLAAEGVLMERAYAASPEDAPARAALLTGLSVRGHGVWTNGAALSERVPTLAAHLARCGYRTACVGLMGLEPLHAPAEARSKESSAYWETGVMANWNGPYHGFNLARLILGRGEDALRQGHYGRWLTKRHPKLRDDLLAKNALPSPAGVPGSHVLNCDPETHPTRYVASQALEIMERWRDAPFFIACCFPDPHPPWAPTASFAARYEADAAPDPADPPTKLDALPPHYAAALKGDGLAEGTAISLRRLGVTPAGVREIRAHVCAMLEQIDEVVGRLLERLDRMGLTEETLVVFTSDRGDFLGDFGLTGAAPFAREAVVRVPLLWRLPGMLPEGERCEGVVSALDVAPTVCAAAGAPLAPHFQGVALDGCMRGAGDSPREAALVEYLGRRDLGLGFKAVLRRDDKWVLHPHGERHERYDLTRDPGETENLYAKSSAEERLEAERLLLRLLAETENRTGEAFDEE